jgi:arylsulfate sulfotransferase
MHTSPPIATAPTSTARFAALLLLLGLSSLATAPPARAQGDTTPPVILTPPVFTPSNHPDCPLVARLQFTTNEPTQTEIVLVEPGTATRLTAEQDFLQVHDVIVAGMRPATSYDVRMAVRDAAGNMTVWPGAFPITTPPLPSTFPPLNVTVAPATTLPYVTLFVTWFSMPNQPSGGGYVIAVDALGRVVWFYFTRDRVINVERMSNGHLLLLSSPFQAQEIDLAGNILRRFWATGVSVTGMPPGAIPVATDQFHHEFHELSHDPAADFLALSTEIRQFQNYPVDEVDLTVTEPIGNVAGDVIVELLEDGTIVRETKLFDILDPHRICYGSLAGFYDPVYGFSTRDWTHGNSVIIDPSDNSYVVSLRHQDAIVKIDRVTGQLVWIHGAPERWVQPWSSKLLTPTGSNFSWQYHQHAPHMQPGGVMTLFDNGNFRVIPPTLIGPASTYFSRGVKYAIDPVAMTTEQIWEYRGTTPFYSGALGDCDPLTGTVLICDGARQVTGQNKSYARLVEVTGRGTPQPVFELIVNDPAVATNPFNWNIYRAQRWRSIYARP